MYQLLPTYTHRVVLEENEVLDCATDSKLSKTCILSPEYPTGMPIWKIHTFYFFQRTAHPLGGSWTLSPEPYPAEKSTNNYIGYSIQPSCMPQSTYLPGASLSDDRTSSFVPAVKRPTDTHHAYILAKSFWYLGPDQAWSTAIYDAASASANLSWYLGANSDENTKDITLGLPSDIIGGGTGGGEVDQTEFVRRLALSRVLIGVGGPLMRVVHVMSYQGFC